LLEQIIEAQQQRIVELTELVMQLQAERQVPPAREHPMPAIY
jgi:hypothetical protein